MYTGPAKQRSTRRRPREAWGVMVTSAIDSQWYFLARRPTYSASPFVVDGFGSKQITVT